jgi:hypothetical protein
MREDQLFGLIASLALLIWLIGRGMGASARRRRQAELAALGLVAAGIVVALALTVGWLVR